MADLAFDTEEIRGTAKTFRETGDDMMSLRKELSAKISNLKDVNWKSDGGKAFQEMYEDDWCKNVDKYVAMLKEMAGMLDSAAADYDALAEKANGLVF